MSQIKSVNCPNCGAQLIGMDGKYFCGYCNSVIHTDQYDKVIKIEKVITTNINVTKTVRNEAKIERIKRRHDPEVKKFLIENVIGALTVIIAFALFIALVILPEILKK